MLSIMYEWCLLSNHDRIFTLMLIKLFHFSRLRLFVVWSKSISKSTTGSDVMRLTGGAETSHNETLEGGKINHTVNSNALLFSWLLQYGTRNTQIKARVENTSFSYSKLRRSN